MSSEDRLSLTTNSNSLAAGDMVEIRVWDLKTNVTRSSSSVNAASILRHRPQLSISQPVSAASSTSSAIHSTDKNDQQQDSSRGTMKHSNSLQYSDASALDGMDETTIDANIEQQQDPCNSKHNSANPNDTSSVSSGDHANTIDTLPTPKPSPISVSTVEGKTVEDLPPVPPRPDETSLRFKPPLQRRSTAPSVPDSSSSFKAQQQQTQQRRPRHTREISDMTDDTAYGAGTPLDSSHQIEDFSYLPICESTNNLKNNNNTIINNSEDDDIWGHLTKSHSVRLSFVMLVTEKSLTSLKGSARTQVSVLRQIADLYQLSSYDTVSIHKIPKHEEKRALDTVSADFVLVTIKDQFVSRGDMHFFQEYLIGSWIYEGKRLYEPARGIQANAREIRHKDQKALSGIITDKTTITFRSRSARIIWLVQMSLEMWDYGSPYERGQEESLCEIYFDKWIAFVRKLFVKWKELETSHSLTVVFFSRTFLGSLPGVISASEGLRDVYGRRYEDHYRIVIENETGPDWDSLVVRIKEAFVEYPREVGWNLSAAESGRRPSTASQGNVLEAVNVTLNLLQYHYLDRDLQRTGNSIVVVSAGNGVFEVDKSLAGVTYQRMMDNGIGSDMLSLGLPALHIAPFFLYINVYQSTEADDLENEAQFYEVPHWMHLSFVSYESEDAVFVDQLLEKETLKEVETKMISENGLQILSNGFLLPRPVASSDPDREQNSTLVIPTLKSNGNTILSPSSKSKPMSKERQLIEGRDFRDILEACRPRDATIIPSALKSMLAISTKQTDTQLNEDLSVGNDSNKADLREWGTLDFDSLKGDSSIRRRRAISLGQESAEGHCPNIGPRSPPRIASVLPFQSTGNDKDIDRSIEVSSQSSSFASQVSSSMLAVSYDRTGLCQQPPFQATGVHMQRTDSLEMDLTCDVEDQSDGALSNDGSGTFSTSGEVNLQNTDSLEDQLKARMKQHDASVLNLPIPSPKLSARQENTKRDDWTLSSHRPAPTLPGQNLQSRSVQRQQGVTTGGIGAALRQYRSTSSGSNTGRNSDQIAISNLNRMGSTGRLNQTMGSMGRLNQTMGSSGRLNQGASIRYLADMGSRGLSPLLLPPAISGQNENTFQPQEGPISRHISIERRLLLSQDVMLSRSGGRNSPALFSRPRILEKDPQSPRSLSVSPPSGSRTVGTPPKDKSLFNRTRQELHPSRSQRVRSQGRVSSRHGVASRKKKALNPFRQKDEDDVLAKASHNRKRWSHVFPVGEVEFKRHSGPNWKSLVAPAILPLRVDYFPKQEDIDHYFTFSLYNVTLSEFEHRNFSSNKDLLFEMVRQRLTQDFQLVSEDYINAGNYRRETLGDFRLAHSAGRSHESTESDQDILRQFLSLGHRLHVLTYDKNTDIIEVTRYNAKSAQANSALNTFTYQYFSFCQETRTYSKVHQTFSKYVDQYNWNRVDRLICGDEDREMREGMRFRRLMFGIIPENFEGNKKAEEDYISRFHRLLEYFEKLREKDDTKLDIKFISSSERRATGADANQRVESTPGLARNSMKRFYIQLKKGKRDAALEWLEVAVDTTFNTSWSFRIMYSWLVASSGKVDTQIQLLQRRCTQFGLNLVPFPQITVSRNVYLNPFKAPAIITIRDKQKADQIDRALLMLDYVHDGVFYTDVKAVLSCLEDGDEFEFGKRFGMPVTGRQFVHRSGTLFLRIFTDKKGKTIVVVQGNYRYMLSNKDKGLEIKYRQAFTMLSDCIDNLSPNSFLEAAVTEKMQPNPNDLDDKTS